jgi:cell wall-associated NlpC family hydrolase
MPASREVVLVESLGLVGTPYLWGAKGDIIGTKDGYGFTPKDPESGRAFALDCSGGYTYALKRAGGRDIRRTHNTDVLWKELPAIEVPQPGDLALYAGQNPTSEDDMEHVMMVVAKVGNLFVVAGPSGGGSSTVSYQIAATRRACYKIKETHLYRTGFRGFRSIAPHLG